MECRRSVPTNVIVSDGSFLPLRHSVWDEIIPPLSPERLGFREYVPVLMFTSNPTGEEDLKETDQ